MGWPADQIGRASVWELLQAYKGFGRFHRSSDEKAGPPSDEAFLAAVAEARRAELRGSTGAG